MGLFNGIAKLAGENLRVKRTANQINELDPQTRQWLDNVFEQAKNGDINCMFALGGYYSKGEYVGYSPNDACFWWTEAASRGHISAQFNLGLLYHGAISEMFYDENLAGYWFNIAANNGDGEAQNYLAQYYKYSNFRDRWIRR